MLDLVEEIMKGIINGYTKTTNDVKFGELPKQLEGTEDIPYNWRNDRLGRGNVAETSEKVPRGIQEESSKLAERLDTERTQGASFLPERHAKNGV